MWLEAVGKEAMASLFQSPERKDALPAPSWGLGSEFTEGLWAGLD